MNKDILLLKPGDPCPLCGEPIKTSDEGTLFALSLIREYLDIADVAAAGATYLREQREAAP